MTAAQAEGFSALAKIAEASNKGQQDRVLEFFSGLSRRGAALEAAGAEPVSPFDPQSIASAIIAKIEETPTLGQVAEVYALAMNEVAFQDRKSWEAINRVVAERFGLRGLEQVKKIARNNGLKPNERNLKDD